MKQYYQNNGQREYTPEEKRVIKYAEDEYKR